MKEEEKEVGAVAIHVYKSYWLAVGSCLAASIFIALFLMQGMITGLPCLHCNVMLVKQFQLQGICQIGGCPTG